MLLKVGDIIEFHCDSNPPPPREWEPERVQEIRIVEEYEDKEGYPVDSIPWADIQSYHCLVVVIGEEHWGRNDDIRPIQP
jgi:hypothetical protein